MSLAQLHASLHRTGCPIADITTRLDPDDQAWLEQVLNAPHDRNAPGYESHAGIADTLTKGGHKVSSDTVNRHRTGRCSCGTR